MSASLAQIAATAPDRTRWRYRSGHRIVTRFPDRREAAMTEPNEDVVRRIVEAQVFFGGKAVG
jgi:hypothetical protein